MTVYKPCYRCPKSGDCQLKRDKQAAMRGHGVTSVRFKCDEFRTLFRVGQRVSFVLMGAGEPCEWGLRDAEPWSGTVYRFANDKVTIILDDGWEELNLKNESGLVALSPLRLHALDEPDDYQRVRRWENEFISDDALDEVRP